MGLARAGPPVDRPQLVTLLGHHHTVPTRPAVGPTEELVDQPVETLPPGRGHLDDLTEVVRGAVPGASRLAGDLELEDARPGHERDLQPDAPVRRGVGRADARR